MGDVQDDGTTSISDPACATSQSTDEAPENEKVGSTSLYDIYKNAGSSAIPMPDSMAMKNAASGLPGAEPISLTAPNFYGSAIPYNSPNIFAPFVVGAHSHIVNKVGCSIYYFARNVLLLVLDMCRARGICSVCGDRWLWW